jgi:hypothetical protein
LTRFLDANRFPLRLKTLEVVAEVTRAMRQALSFRPSPADVQG